MMGIWMPYANVRKNLLVLSDSHLADVVFQGLDCLRDIPRHDDVAKWAMGRHTRMWFDRPGALLFYVISAEAEYRRRNLGEVPQVLKAFTWYSDLDMALAPVPPWWFGHPMFHRTQCSHLIKVDPEWYARRLPLETPLDLALLWPMAEPHNWEQSGRPVHSPVGHGRSSSAHKQHVRNQFMRREKK